MSKVNKTNFFTDLHKFVQAFESVAGTVKAKEGFNAQEDAEYFKQNLNKAGYERLCDLLVTRSTEQRLEMVRSEKEMFI